MESISIDALVERTMADAPEVLHHVFALEGANEVFKGLKTEESKAAYLIYIIGTELYKADKELDPTKISHGPNDLRFHIMRSQSFFDSYPYNISILDLGEFEDLYYATCAKLKDLHQGVDILLSNGFKARHDTHFTYQTQPLATLGAVGAGEFKESLITHADLLFSHEVITLLDNGIKRKNMRDHKSMKLAMQGDETTHNDLDNVAYFHPGIWGEEAHALNRNRRLALAGNLTWMKDVKGLQDMSNMSCGMTFAMLAEKYRSLNVDEGLDWAAIYRPTTPEAPQATPPSTQEQILHQAYVSPWNLDERAKKLNDPDGPEMPCICDEDCICAALCASDPTQNCLCEENALFARVTEGMDIDELDVPDLVRYESQASNSSRSSATPTAHSEESIVEEVFVSGADATQLIAEAGAPQQDELAVPGEVLDQTSEQKHWATDFTNEMEKFGKEAAAASDNASMISLIPSMASNDFDDAASIAGTIKSMVSSIASNDIDDAASMTGTINSMVPSMASDGFDDAASVNGSMNSMKSSMTSDHLADAASMTNTHEPLMALSERSIFAESNGLPLGMTSSAYRELLRQPFAKKCPHPPKRASLAQRIFGFHSNAQKQLSATEQHYLMYPIPEIPMIPGLGALSDASYMSAKLAQRGEYRRL